MNIPLQLCWIETMAHDTERSKKGVEATSNGGSDKQRANQIQEADAEGQQRRPARRSRPLQHVIIIIRQLERSPATTIFVQTEQRCFF